jgi:hypothetical protein
MSPEGDHEMQQSNHLPTVGRVASFGHRYRDECSADDGSKAGYRRRVRRADRKNIRKEVAEYLNR